MADSYVVAIGFRIESNPAGTAVRIRYPDRARPGSACFAVAGDARVVARRVRWAHRLRLLRWFGLCALAAAAVVAGVALVSGTSPGVWFSAVLGVMAAVFVYGILGGQVGRRPDLRSVGVAIPLELFDRLEDPERDALMRLANEDEDVQLEAGRLVLADYERADRQARLERERHVQDTAQRMLYDQD